MSCRTLLDLVLLLVICSFIAADSTAWAEPKSREGWLVGMSVGVGPAGATDGEGVTQSTDDGVSPQIRFGKMIGPRLLLGAELDGWLIEQGDLEHKVRRSLQTWGLAVTYFPGDLDRNGVYLRAGAGIALGSRALVELREDPDEGIVQEHADRDDEWGWGLTLGVGFEQRVSTHLAAGLALNCNYLVIDEIWHDTAWFSAATLNLGWYF